MDHLIIIGGVPYSPWSRHKPWGIKMGLLAEREELYVF
jgi:hypothetical protein